MRHSLLVVVNKYSRLGFALVLGVVVLAAVGAAFAGATATPTPGFADGAFCTYGKGYFSNSAEAAQRIQGGLPFSIGGGSNTYTWTQVAALQQAVGSGESPGAFSGSATNATDMGTGGDLAAQTLALTLNINFSERVLTPTGFAAVSLVDMNGVKLDGVPLTSAEAGALNGQAVVQVREAANVALSGGPLPYGLSFAQLTDLERTLNESFIGSYKANGVLQPCGKPSKFAQAHMYQPYVTSNAFAGTRPASIALFTPKPPYNSFSGEVVYVGRGCPAGSINGTNPADPYLADPAGKIALIERGACRFDNKVARAQLNNAAAVIVFNNAAGGEALVVMGGNNPVTLPDGAVVNITIPAAFVQRSTGLLLANTPPVITPPVTAFVQQ
jgi:PA domain